jgi:hypothetical protein
MAEFLKYEKDIGQELLLETDSDEEMSSDSDKKFFSQNYQSLKFKLVFQKQSRSGFQCVTVFW